jgi:hypothetical protein
MTEHYSNGEWHQGVPFDCKKCRPESRKAPGYLPEGYRDSTRTVIKDSRGSREVKHWSGRQDAHVNVAPVRARTSIKE